MNAHDSEIIAGMLRQRGYKIIDSLDNADIVLFNTCSVRQHAEARVWGKVGELKKLKAQSAKLKIGIIGCMAQNYKEKIFERLPHVDLVCGATNMYDLPDLLKNLNNSDKKVLAVNKSQRDPRKKIDISKRENSVKAFVSIVEGCDNYCSYCIVPYVRGPEVSRPVNVIVDEIKRLVDDGVKEVMLLGQNVNSYKSTVDSPQLTDNKKQFTVYSSQFTGDSKNKKNDFVKLLEKLNKIEGLERIRFMTSHPKDADEDLFKAISGLPRVCEHLHLPVQSGSSRILGLMNRGYTREDYFKKIESLKKTVKDCAITTDIIVGFPTETEKDFNETIKLMKEVEFDSAFIFKYSPRNRTKAALLKDDVEYEIKQERNQILLQLQGDISKKKNEALVGRTLEVLIEDVNKKNKAEFVGHSRQDKLVIFKKNKHSLGKLVNVRISSSTNHTLIGETE